MISETTVKLHLTVSSVYLPKSSNGKGSDAISRFIESLVALRKAGNPAILGGDLNMGMERILKVLREGNGTGGRKYDLYGDVKPITFKGSPTSWGRKRFCASKDRRSLDQFLVLKGNSYELELCGKAKVLRLENMGIPAEHFDHDMIRVSFKALLIPSFCDMRMCPFDPGFIWGRSRGQLTLASKVVKQAFAFNELWKAKPKTIWRPRVDRYGVEIVDSPEVECDEAAESFTKLVHKVGNLSGAKSPDPKMYLGLAGGKNPNPNAPIGVEYLEILLEILKYSRF